MKPMSSIVLKENTDAELKIIENQNNKFKIDFKVFGKNIFQNLILTVNAYSNDLTDPIPIKCVWKRVINDTQTFIQDINSNSYIPSAEDIGYIIEVEVTTHDDDKGNDKAFAQYGPIMIPNDIKHSLEMLLSQGEAKFSCYIYNIEEQVKSINRDIEIVMNYQEFKIIEKFPNSSPLILENIRLSSLNPIIRLHHLDTSRFSLNFIESRLTNYSDKEKGNNEEYGMLKTNIKSKYNLISMSKNQRELLYLLFHSFSIDEKLKSYKLFNSLNYKILPEEMKVGVIDLISEIKTLREENNVLMHNSNYYATENNSLKRELKDLEDDFQMTLEQLNNPNIKIEIDNDRDLRNITTNIDTSRILNNTVNNNLLDIKKQYDDLSVSHSSLISIQKALREENKSLQNKLDLSKNHSIDLNKEVVELNNKLSIMKEQSSILQKSNNFLTDLNNKITIERDDSLNEKKELKQKIDFLTLSQNNDKNKDSEEKTYLKEENNQLKVKLEKIEYDNSNFKIQNNMLKSQKDELIKEMTKYKNERDELALVIKNQKDMKIDLINSEIQEKDLTIKDLRNQIKCNNDKIALIESNYEKLLEKDKENQRSDYVANIKNDNYANNKINSSSILDESVYRIGREDYEEFDNYKREKDEYECQLLYLKSNNEAMKLELELLRQQIKK